MEGIRRLLAAHGDVNLVLSLKEHSGSTAKPGSATLSNTIYFVSPEKVLAQPKRKLQELDVHDMAGEDLAASAKQFKRVNDFWERRSKRLGDRPFPSRRFSSLVVDARTCADFDLPSSGKPAVSLVPAARLEINRALPLVFKDDRLVVINDSNNGVEVYSRRFGQPVIGFRVFNKYALTPSLNGEMAVHGVRLHLLNAAQTRA